MLTSVCSDSGVFHWFVSVLQVAGTLVLAVPALSVDLRRKKAEEFAQNGDREMSAQEKAARDESIEHVHDQASAWDHRHSWCLRIGYLMLLVSVLLSFGADVYCPTP